jgi:predicted metal-binding membrane protein
MQDMDAAMQRDMAMSMNDMAPAWTAVDMALLFMMWTAMMAAMMVPGANQSQAARAVRAACCNRNFPARISRGLVRLFAGCDGRAMAAAILWLADADDGVIVVLLVRRAFHRRGSLSIQSVQADVPGLLPLARKLHFDGMA